MTLIRTGVSGRGYCRNPLVRAVVAGSKVTNSTPTWDDLCPAARKPRASGARWDDSRANTRQFGMAQGGGLRGPPNRFSAIAMQGITKGHGWEFRDSAKAPETRGMRGRCGME